MDPPSSPISSPVSPPVSPLVSSPVSIPAPSLVAQPSAKHCPQAHSCASLSLFVAILYSALACNLRPLQLCRWLCLRQRQVPVSIGWGIERVVPTCWLCRWSCSWTSACAPTPSSCLCTHWWTQPAWVCSLRHWSRPWGNRDDLHVICYPWAGYCLWADCFLKGAVTEQALEFAPCMPKFAFY